MSNVAGDSSDMCDSEYFAKFRQRVKAGIIGDKDLKEYAVRFGKKMTGAKSNLALVTAEYKNSRISASEYMVVNFMTKAALGIVSADDITAVRKVWSGSLDGEAVQTVAAANTQMLKPKASAASSSLVSKDEDVIYLRSFWQKIKDQMLSDNDLMEYATRFGQNKADMGSNLALVFGEYIQERLSTAEYAALNFITKAALGIIGVADIGAVRRAWNRNLTGKDIQDVLEANNRLQKAFSKETEYSSSELGDQEYFTGFLKKVKQRAIKHSDMQEYAARFGKDKKSVQNSFALVNAAYSSDCVSAAEYAAVNLIAKAALESITAMDIKAAQRAWGGQLTDQDIKDIFNANSEIEKTLPQEPKIRQNEISNDEFFRLFRQKAKRGKVSECDWEEYRNRFDIGATTANLALVSSEYKDRLISAAEYIMLNLLMKAALGVVRTADITAARKAWGGGLTDVDVQAILAVNDASAMQGVSVCKESDTSENISAELVYEDANHMQNEVQTETVENNNAADLSENSIEEDPISAENCIVKESDARSDLSDSEYFAAFRQKVITEAVDEIDLQEYADRFGKDTEVTMANLKIFTAQYKNKLIDVSKYAELNFMAKAALGTLTKADLQAVRGVWRSDLTDEEVQAVLDGKDISENRAMAEESIDIEGAEDSDEIDGKDISENRAIADESIDIEGAEDSDEIDGKDISENRAMAEESIDTESAQDSDEIDGEDNSNLNNNEYFAVFQQKVIDGTIQQRDMQEYASRFGKDPEGTRENLKLFTLQYRNNFIAGEKFAELNFIAKAALGIATEIDMKAARGVWGGGLTYKDVQAIFEQKNKG
ncbi:MAG: hypothetical protein LLG02_05730 [Pelosinus sp.]|nr:hypothetical protein [Pelosinus sp.]